MLSDACFEFLESLRDAAQTLAEQSAHYANSPLRYGEDSMLCSLHAAKCKPTRGTKKRPYVLSGSRGPS
jgi:hypothetical protein